VKRAVAQIGDVALLAKPVAEASNGKRLAKLGDGDSAGGLLNGREVGQARITSGVRFGSFKIDRESRDALLISR